MARRRIRSGDGINIPLDLTVEILKRLPTKSIARFRCVSKKWETIIGDYIVKNSIVTRFLTPPPSVAPHFILDITVKLFLQVFSYTYSDQTTNENNQLYQENIFGESKVSTEFQFQYVRGLIGFGSPNHGTYSIHNPTTRQSISLPDTGIPPDRFYLFGYDPLGNQYKVVCLKMSKNEEEQSCKIFTFGDPRNEWRNIKCDNGSNSSFGSVVCINGAIYYTAMTENRSYVIVSFDVGSEKFNHVQAPDKVFAIRGGSALVNYQGKLGWICRNNINENDMDVCVMENEEKQEWSKITYKAVLQGIHSCMFRFAVTHPGGEIVIVSDLHSMFASDVYYYNPNINSRRRVVIQTPTSFQKLFVRVWPVTDHVENIMSLL